MTTYHCGVTMMQVYERTSTEDRYELALTVETIDTLYQCMQCGAKLSCHLEQPKLDAHAE